MASRTRRSEAPLSLAIEGVIGVGKTTLAAAISERLGAVRLSEAAIANPFLDDFYKNRSRYALSCQLAFLYGRYRQFAAPRPIGLPVVADHSLAKDPIFAQVNLREPRELDLYRQCWQTLQDREIFQPRVIVYLTASLDEVRRRIRGRGRKAESAIDVQYLAELVDAYEAWFNSVVAARQRVVVVSADGSGIAGDGQAVERLIEACRQAPVGLSYCNPEA